MAYEKYPIITAESILLIIGMFYVQYCMVCTLYAKTD